MAKRDVELIIRAKNEASSTVDAVAKSLAELTEKQDVLGASAKKADGLLGQLADEFDKLKAVSGSAQALGKIQEAAERAGDAFVRQAQQLAQSRTELTDLTRTQQMVARAGENLQQEVEQSATALAKETRAAAAAKTQLDEYAAAQRKAAKAAVAAEKALATAQKRYAEKPTAGNERKLVDSGLRVQQTRQAAREAALAEATLTRAYREQAAQLQTNKAAHSTLAASLGELQGAERKLAVEISKTESAVARQSQGLDEARDGYNGLQQVVQRAEDTFRSAAQSQGMLGRSSQQMATELTVLKARMQELQAASRAPQASKPVIDPAALRESNLGLREAMTTIRAATNEASRSSVSMRDLSRSVEQVARSGQQLDGLLKAVERQDRAVSNARQEWASAQAEVKRLAQAMRAAGQPSEQLAAAFGRAQGQARAAKDAFQQEGAAADQLSSDLRRAGLQHNSLADAQGRLKASITSNNAALTQGRAALIGFQGATNQAAGGSRQTANGIRQIAPAAQSTGSALRQLVQEFGKLNQGQRTTLSLTQRLRGQMLSMAAAAGGLYGVQSALQGVVQAQIDLDAMQARFMVGFAGDQQRANDAMALVNSTADDLGLNLRTLGLQYAKLTAASLGTNLEGEKTAVIFRSMAEASRALYLTDDELAGAFKALTDIMSKGTIQAEELKGQLGDRFPGAMQIMAQALGKTTAELTKMMEQGELTSDSLYEFAQAVAERVSPAMDQARVSIAAQLERLRNEVFRTSVAIANSGFLDELEKGVIGLADALKDPAVQEGFKKLGYGLGQLIRLSADFIEHIDTIAVAVGTLVGLQVSASLVNSLRSLIGAARSVGGVLSTVGKGMVALKAASVAAGGGVTGLVTVLAGGAVALAPLVAGFAAAAAGLALLGKAAHDYYRGVKARQALEEMQAKLSERQIALTQEYKDRLAELNELRFQAGKSKLMYDDAAIRSSEEVIKMTDAEIDKYQELLLTRMKQVGAERTAEMAKGKQNLELIAQLNLEEEKLARAIEETAIVEQGRAKAVQGTAGAVAQVGNAAEDATAKADALKARLDAVAQMNFDNSILALEKVHTAKLAALTVSGADEQKILAATTKMESERLDVVRRFADRQLQLVAQDVWRRKEILDGQTLDDAERAEKLKEIEANAAQARIQIVQNEVQAVSSARDQALNRYMSSLQKVADLDRRIADIRLQGEFQIKDIQRSAMNDQAAYRARQAELAQLTGRIEREVAQGNFEVAEALAQRQMSLAQSLNQEVKEGEKVIVSKEQAARNAVAGTQRANENLIGVLQKRKDLEKAEAERQRKLYENLTATLEKLNKTLAGFSGAQPIDIPVTVDELAAQDDLTRAIQGMRAEAFKGKVGVPVTADTRDYVAKINADVLSKDGTQVQVGVFLEDGAYKLKVHEIENETIVATAQVRFSGADLDKAIAEAKALVEQGVTHKDFPRMQLAFDSAATFADFQKLSKEVQRKMSEQSFTVTSQFQADTDDVQEVIRRLSSDVTEAPVAFDPDTTAAMRARAELSKPIIVPVQYVSSGQPSKYANGGAIRVPGFSNGGSPGGLIRGPGTGTSDSILAAVSNREYIVRAMAVRKYGEGFLHQLNAGQIDPDRLASATGKGGLGDTGDSMTLNLTINGRETGALSGSRASVQNFVDSLHELARQVGG